MKNSNTKERLNAAHPLLGDGNIRLTAVRANRTFVERRTAVRAPLLKHLTADRAVRRADWIGLVAIWTDKPTTLHLIGVVGRAVRIRAEALLVVVCEMTVLNRSRRLFLLAEIEWNVELLGECPDDIVVQLRAVALLKHGERGLLAADFGGKYALREACRTARLLHFQAELWTQIRHRGILWTFFSRLTRGELSTNQQDYQLINLCSHIC